MTIFGVYVPLTILLIGVAVLILVLALIIFSIKSSKGKAPEDLDKREVFGDFHGLLTQSDFDTRADDPALEVYRMQWIQAPPGDEKDNFLLLYLALKQLNQEQDADEEEWTQEQCEKRMDEIVAELSEKTGLKLLAHELPESEYETYFNEGDKSEDGFDEKEEKEE